MVLIAYSFMCLIFSTTFLAIKIGIDAGVPPFFSAGLRFFLAGLILFAIMMVKRKTTLRLFFRKEMLLTGIGLTFGTFSTLYWAEQFVPSGTAAVLSATGPMMILLIQTFILKTKANLSSFIGCLVGILGVFLLILPNFTFLVNSLMLGGCLLIMAGEVFYASGTIYSKNVIKQFDKISPIALNAVQMMHGGILLMILSLMTEKFQVSALVSPAAIESSLYLIVVGSMGGHSLYYWLVSKTNPIFPSTWLFVSPILAMVLGVVFYHETLSWMSGIGALTIILGTIIISLPKLRSFPHSPVKVLSADEEERCRTLPS
ncbi:EamA family transporter [Bacillus sp. BRMEA1]|uniref:DMT family transporter n=1 Tax=Neobacillus endophyticus TaxID=2738405 RepID=UPI001563C8D0|nr:EamA family transporter [Neobacillus endophyticus]NRD79960.1 EamA family transporter [Neobacillus endophyticus]